MGEVWRARHSLLAAMPPFKITRGSLVANTSAFQPTCA